MRKAALLLTLAALVAPALAVDFYNVATIDTNALGIANPGSVAYAGGDLYVARLFAGTDTIFRLTSPLSSPAVGGQFGGAVTGNGWVNLTLGANYVAAGSNNAGAADALRAFNLDGTLINSKVPADYGRTRFDGAAADPGWNGGQGAGVSVTGYGVGTRLQVSSDLNTVLDNAFNIFVPNWGTGCRDISYDRTSGDMYIRMVNGVVRGKRVAPQSFTKLDGTTAGLEGIVFLPNIQPFPQSAINVEALPNWDGMNLVVLNDRVLAAGVQPTFANRVKVFSADTLQQQITPNWLNLDGTPFNPGLSDSGIYDFSYDPSTGLLVVSDYTLNSVYFFARTPEPTSLMLLGFGGLALIRRR